MYRELVNRQSELQLVFLNPVRTAISRRSDAAGGAISEDREKTQGASPVDGTLDSESDIESESELDIELDSELNGKLNSQLNSGLNSELKS